MKKIGLGIILGYFVSVLQAQEVEPFQNFLQGQPLTQFLVDSWDNEDGLPTNAVLDIAKTSEGYMWLATFNGLVRFDGVEFKVFDKSNTPEFKTNNLSTLLVDSQDRLWIGTNGGGLMRMQGDQFHYFDTDSLIRTPMITVMEEGEDGIIWIGTRSGLAFVKNDTLSRLSTGPLSYPMISSMDMDEIGRLWVGTTTNGLFVYDGEQTLQFGTQEGLPSDFVRATFSDSQNRIWIGTDRGAALINESGIFNLDSLPNSPTVFTNAFFEDEHGHIWMGCNDGLRRYKQEFELLTSRQGLSHDIVQSLMQDDEGNIWVGTYRGGLNRLKKGKFLNISRPEGISNEVINVTYEDGDKVWIGSDNGLTCLSEGKLETFNIGRRTAGNRIRDIYRDSKSRLWLCTYRGLVQFEDGQIVRRYTTADGLSSNNTRRIVEDQEGALWVGTAFGLNRLKDGKIEIFNRESGLGDLFVMSLFVDNSGKLWVGTDGGGVYYLEQERFKRALSTDAINDIIFNIFQDYDGSYWFSSNRGVIYLLDTLEFTINKQHGLISNNIFQTMLDDKGQLWFTSDRGLMRTTLSEVRNLVKGQQTVLKETRIFDRADGMRSAQVTAASKSATTRNGKLFIATLNGITIVDSRQVPINEVLPKTALTEIYRDDLRIPIDETITLEAGVRRLEFHYTGLSFYAPEKVKFKYRLENFDEDWVIAGDRRTAYYTNLPPGDYVFKVQAANNDGIWNTKPAYVRINQQAYFYQTTWFYVLLALALVGFGAFLYYLRALEIKRRNVVLQQVVAERTLDIRNQNKAITTQREELQQLNLVKDKLLSVISHDLRGPIAAVAGLLGLLKSGHLNYKELMTQSSSLNNEVHGLTYLLDNLLSWSKSQMQGFNLNREEVPLSQVVEENLRVIVPMSDHKELNISNEIPKDLMVYTDRILLSMVIRNLMMNAIKFTHKKGEIKLTCKQEGDTVTVCVQDNGVGISKEDLKRLFDTQNHYSKMGTANEAGTGIGLLLCKEFLELDGGRIWAESEPGKGSVFKFTLQASMTPSITK